MSSQPCYSDVQPKMGKRNHKADYLSISGKITESTNQNYTANEVSYHPYMKARRIIMKPPHVLVSPSLPL